MKIKPVFLSLDEPTIVRRFVLARQFSDSIYVPTRPSVACIRRFHQLRIQTLDPDGRISIIPIKIYDINFKYRTLYI